jgi:prefoldin beta subunit
MTDRKEALKKIQEAEQTIQNLLQQKQAFLSQNAEIEEALNELQNTETAYQIVANIMIKKDTEELKKSLSEQKEIIDLRIKTIEKQENRMKEQIKEHQESVMKG